MLRNVMSTAQQGGLTVMRAWVDAVDPQYALQTSPGVYNEAVFRGLDYVLDLARQMGIRVRPFSSSAGLQLGSLPNAAAAEHSTSMLTFSLLTACTQQAAGSHMNPDSYAGAAGCGCKLESNMLCGPLRAVCRSWLAKKICRRSVKWRLWGSAA